MKVAILWTLQKTKSKRSKKWTLTKSKMNVSNTENWTIFRTLGPIRKLSTFGPLTFCQNDRPLCFQKTSDGHRLWLDPHPSIFLQINVQFGLRPSTFEKLKSAGTSTFIPSDRSLWTWLLDRYQIYHSDTWTILGSQERSFC